MIPVSFSSYYYYFFLLFYGIVNFYKNYLIFNVFFHENYFYFFMFRDVPRCSGMFRNVPACPGMFRVPCSVFRVPGFIDAEIPWFLNVRIEIFVHHDIFFHRLN